MERIRHKLNSTIATFVLKNGGCYIHYPDIKTKTKTYLVEDGVHLASLGNEVFLNIIQGALETFLTSRHCGKTFP